MVANRNREASDGDRGQDWPHLVSFGTLLASVVGVLVLGAVLRTETPGAVEAGLTTLASSGPVASDPPRPPAAPASLDRLAQRALADAARMGNAGGAWTAQLGLFCDAGRVQEMLAQFGDREAFHILPSLYRDEACFRVCWGRYASADKARAARDLPAQLRGVAPTPLPKSVAEVLE